ncbi:glutamate-5-semialdehyde dehydrogenase [Lachnospiraceae bacterium G11]|nr:glutamate-5-semialdehyde dehydrogenase [Lachnospiraceae bacterium G11]
MELIDICKAACRVKYSLQTLSDNKINEALYSIAEALISSTESILEANAVDLANGKAKNMPEGLLDRLALSDVRIKAIAEGLKEVAALDNPKGRIIESFSRPNGMMIDKIRVPFGVIGIIYESRPNVTADAFALCFKTGNAVILKGGSDAINSNMAITKAIKSGLKKCGIDEDAINLIESTDRSVTTEFMRMKEYVDLLIPRGGAKLIESVVMNATIPVIETGTGNCHVFVDEFADIKMAANIIENAKTQRIGVCNACESLIVHRSVLKPLFDELSKREKMKRVEIRADEASLPFAEGAIPATEEDFGTEYLDYKLSVKTVDSVSEAIDHINRYSTHHSETIVTENKDNAELFLANVDAACVYHNVSTRFTDGFEFGFGAEIGISTQKLHARGPMGLNELTSYKYVIRGNGQVRG